MTPRAYRYYDLVLAAFVTVLLCANLVGASKVCRIGPVTFGAGVLFFPISYVFGDVLTEVYGYARARKVVWAGFGALLFASLMSWAVLAFPPSPEWHDGEIINSGRSASSRRPDRQVRRACRPNAHTDPPRTRRQGESDP